MTKVWQRAPIHKVREVREKYLSLDVADKKEKTVKTEKNVPGKGESRAKALWQE